MSSFYLLLSDAIMVIHFAWVAFNLFGFFFARKFPKIKILHIGTLTATAVLMLAEKPCPLTIWEQQLRRRIDPALSYEESFLSHYLGKVIYIDAPPHTLTVLTSILALLAIFFYLILPFLKKRRNR